MSTEFTNAREEQVVEAAVAELKEFEQSQTESNTSNESESKSSEPERKYTEVELEQMEHGWDPNKADGVSAKEYKRVGEIIEAKRKATKEANQANKEVNELTKTVKLLVEQNRAVEKATREQTLLEVTKRKQEAEEQGDIQAYKMAEAEAASIRALPPIEETPKVEPLDPAVIEFQEENKEWLTGTKPGDMAMQAYVKAKVEFYMNNNPDIDPKVAVKEIKEGLSEEFPNKFTNPNKANLSLTMKSTSSSSGGSGSYSQSRLNMDQRVEFDLIKKADSTYTLKEYIDQLVLIGKIEK